jgi:hypothetical protein
VRDKPRSPLQCSPVTVSTLFTMYAFRGLRHMHDLRPGGVVNARLSIRARVIYSMRRHSFRRRTTVRRGYVQ